LLFTREKTHLVFQAADAVWSWFIRARLAASEQFGLTVNIRMANIGMAENKPD